MGLKHFNGEVDTEYLQESARRVEKIKEKSYELMDLQKGMKVLDLGCGPGIDVRKIAELVGPEGEVIGLDNDIKMIEEARKRTMPANAVFIHGEAVSIPFADQTFDAVRAERLFQVLPPSVNPNLVIREIIRVTKKDGIIVLVDSDWGTATVNYENAELTNKLLHFFASVCRPNGYAGRQFYELMKKHGLVITQVEAFPVMMFDFAETPFEQWLTKEALVKRIATEDELRHWNEDLSKKTEQGQFFSFVNMVIISGRR